MNKSLFDPCAGKTSAEIRAYERAAEVEDGCTVETELIPAPIATSVPLREPKRHTLKVWVEYFSAVWDNRKTFEVRKNDRDFQAGDRLLLREYDHTTGTYTGREIACWVSYVLYGGMFGVANDVCVMALSGTVRNQMVNGGYRSFEAWIEA